MRHPLKARGNAVIASSVAASVLQNVVGGLIRPLPPKHGRPTTSISLFPRRRRVGRRRSSEHRDKLAGQDCSKRHHLLTLAYCLLFSRIGVA